MTCTMATGRGWGAEAAGGGGGVDPGGGASVLRRTMSLGN